MPVGASVRKDTMSNCLYEVVNGYINTCEESQNGVQWVPNQFLWHRVQALGMQREIKKLKKTQFNQMLRNYLPQRQKLKDSGDEIISLCNKHFPRYMENSRSSCVYKLERIRLKSEMPKVPRPNARGIRGSRTYKVAKAPVARPSDALNPPPPPSALEEDERADIANTLVQLGTDIMESGEPVSHESMPVPVPLPSFAESMDDVDLPPWSDDENDAEYQNMQLSDGEIEDVMSIINSATTNTDDSLSLSNALALPIA